MMMMMNEFQAAGASVLAKKQLQAKAAQRNGAEAASPGQVVSNTRYLNQPATGDVYRPATRPVVAAPQPEAPEKKPGFWTWAGIAAGSTALVYAAVAEGGRFGLTEGLEKFVRESWLFPHIGEKEVDKAAGSNGGSPANPAKPNPLQAEIAELKGIAAHLDDEAAKHVLNLEKMLGLMHQDKYSEITDEMLKIHASLINNNADENHRVSFEELKQTLEALETPENKANLLHNTKMAYIYALYVDFDRLEPHEGILLDTLSEGRLDPAADSETVTRILKDPDNAKYFQSLAENHPLFARAVKHAFPHVNLQTHDDLPLATLTLKSVAGDEEVVHNVNYPIDYSLEAVKKLTATNHFTLHGEDGASISSDKLENDGTFDLTQDEFYLIQPNYHNQSKNVTNGGKIGIRLKPAEETPAPPPEPPEPIVINQNDLEDLDPEELARLENAAVNWNLLKPHFDTVAEYMANPVKLEGENRTQVVDALKALIPYLDHSALTNQISLIPNARLEVEEGNPLAFLSYGKHTMLFPSSLDGDKLTELAENHSDKFRFIDKNGDKFSYELGHILLDDGEMVEFHEPHVVKLGEGLGGETIVNQGQIRLPNYELTPEAEAPAPTPTPTPPPAAEAATPPVTPLRAASGSVEAQVANVINPSNRNDGDFAQLISNLQEHHPEHPTLQTINTEFDGQYPIKAGTVAHLNAIQDALRKNEITFTDGKAVWGDENLAPKLNLEKVHQGATLSFTEQGKPLRVITATFAQFDPNPRNWNHQFINHLVETLGYKVFNKSENSQYTKGQLNQLGIGSTEDLRASIPQYGVALTIDGKSLPGVIEIYPNAQ